MALKPAELDELKDNFAYNDSNGDGRIDFREFIELLTALDAYYSDEEARVGFAAIDTDHDHAISLDEFIAWWSDR